MYEHTITAYVRERSTRGAMVIKKHNGCNLQSCFFTFSTHTWSSMLQESFFYLHAWSSILEYQISLDMWSSMLQNNRFQHTQMDMLQDPIFFIFLTSKIKHVIGFAFSILARGSTGRPIRIGKLGSYLRHRIWGGGKK